MPRSALLSDLLVPERATLAERTEAIDGREAWVVTVKDPWPAGRARVWIDRERGVPLRIEHREERPQDDQSRTTSLTEVKEMHRLPNGGWIAVAARRSFPGAPDVQGQEIEVARESITIAAADFPESLFAIAFAEGAKVGKAGAFKDPGLNRRLDLVRNRSLPDGYLEFVESSEPLGLEDGPMPGFPRYAHTRVIHDRSGRFWAHRVALRACPLAEGTGIRLDAQEISREEVLVFDGVACYQYGPRDPDGERLALREPLRRPEADHLRAIHGLPPALAAPFLSEEFVGSNFARKNDGSFIYFDERYSVTARAEDGFVTAALLDEWSLEGSQVERTPAGDSYLREVTITAWYRWRDDGGAKRRTRVRTTLKVLHASTGLVPPASLFDVPLPRGIRVQDNTREGWQFIYDWEERKKWDPGVPAPAEPGKTAPPLTVERWHNAPDGVQIGNGRITVIEFWAHWCVPCIAGLQRLEEHARRHRDPGVQFVAVHSAEMAPEKLAAVIRNLGITFPVAQDAATGKASWTTFEAFGAGAYPSLFVIDGEGRVSERFERTEPAIERVETLLGKKPGG
jgi:thiol-disulfide isomerase/thioredoxin